MDKPERPLRVLYVTPRYLPLIGGTEVHTYEIARRLAENGHEVTVLTTDPNGNLPEYEVHDGIQVRRVAAWPRSTDYHFAPRIYQTIQQGEWDLVHCQGSHTFVAPLTMLAALRARIPYVVTFHSGGHSSWVRTALRGTQWRLLRPLLARAEQLISVSSFEASFFQQYLGLPPQRFAVIPNGAQLPHPERETVADSSPLILSIGRLERYKGHHRVIAALPHVARHYPNIRLLIVGTGSYEQKLRHLAARHGVADRVDIRSVAGSNRSEMASLLLRARLTILLSDYESQGIAVMEALALGRPVLVADSSALRELAASGLVRATPLGGTAEEVAQEIVQQLRYPLIPPEVTLPTWDQCYEALLGIYRNIAAGTLCAS